MDSLFSILKIYRILLNFHFLHRLNVLLYIFDAKKVCKKKSFNKLSLAAGALLFHIIHNTHVSLLVFLSIMST